MVERKQQGIEMEKIESNVPVPKRHGLQKYPFPDMEIGDSILFENATHDSNCVHAGKRYFSRTGKKMIARKEGTGIRIWRTE